jgi:predicted MPP superfamily phosphohydrolase
LSYAHWLEPTWLEISHRTIPVSAGSAQPIRVLHLTDLHASREVPLPFIAEAIARGVALQPDLICVTGDFITRRNDIPPGYDAVLRRLADAAPTYACLGNHDGGAWTARFGGLASSAAVRALLSSAGIVCIHNDVTTQVVRGRPVQLIGLGDIWSGECIEDLTFAGLGGAPRALRLVLSHNPDSKERLAPYDWDVLLCGHTHGGQIGLPFFRSYFAPVVDKNYIDGLHPWNHRWLHIGRGVGNLHGIRFNCRPEVTLLTIV